MTSQGEFFLGGITGIVSCNFTASRGTTPSQGVIYVAPNTQARVPKIADLRIKYGDGVDIRYNRCVVTDKAEDVEQSTGRTIWAITFVDAREFWKLGQVSGAYNVTVGTKVKQIREDTLKKPKDILKEIFEALGYPKADLSDVPTDVYPELVWDAVQPARAIDDICNQLGCVVCFNPGNRIKVCRDGKGKPLPNYPAKTYSVEMQEPLVPDVVRFNGGRNLIETDIELEPYGLELDGELKRINELSYKPEGDGWEMGDPYTWSTVRQKAYRDLAVKSVFRYWVPKLPITLPNKFFKIEQYAQMMPMLSHLVRTAKYKTGSETREQEMPAIISGSFLRGSIATPEALEQMLGDASIPPNLRDKIWTDGFRIEEDRCLIILNRPAYLRPTEGKLIGKMVPARLFLRVALQYRDKKTRAWIRHTKDRQLSRTPNRMLPMYVTRDDIALKFYLDWDSSETGKNNLTEFNKGAAHYLDIAVQELQGKQAGSADYVGIYKIDLDGALSQQTYYIEEGTGVAGMRVSRNREEVVTAGSYEQKQLFSRIVSIANQHDRQMGDRDKKNR